MIDEHTRDQQYIASGKSLLDTFSRKAEKAVKVKEILTLEEQLLHQVQSPLGRIRHYLERKFYTLSDAELQSLDELQIQHDRIREIVHSAKSNYFNLWRESIQKNQYGRQRLFEELNDCCDHHKIGESREIYDLGDVFIDELLEMKSKPGVFVGHRTEEMNAYGATPALIIHQMVSHLNLTEKDVLYDLGSGIGKVTMMMHLLSGAAAIGVEYDSGMQAYAEQKTKDLNLSRVHCINADAATVNFQDASHIFMFNSFSGTILQAVKKQIDLLAQRKALTICTLNMGQFQLDCASEVSYSDGRRGGLKIYRAGGCMQLKL